MTATESGFNPANWDGDGLPEDDDEALELFWDLGFLPNEVLATYEHAKRQAWFREQLAKYESAEWNLTLTRYFWRRAERLRKLAALYDNYDGPATRHSYQREKDD